MSTFNLAIITPEGKLFDGEAEFVNLPGSEGRFEVLAQHMNLIASLKPGVIELLDSKGSKQSYIVFDGIAEVNSESCSVLVEKGVSADKIDVSSAKEELQKVRHELTKADTEILKSQLEKEEQYLESIISF